MSKLWIKRGLYGLIAALVVFGFFWALRDKPIPVDVEAISRGSLKVTVDEEGRTRIKEIYVVSAPTGGTFRRTALEVGDDVQKDQTVVAIIEPSVPSFLNIRTRREVEAAVEAANAAVRLAETEVAYAQSTLRFSQNELERAKKLSKNNRISTRSLEKSVLDEASAKASLEKAKANLDLREKERERVKAGLIGPDNTVAFANTTRTCCYEIKAPVSGRVLKLVRESEQVVQAGSPLIEIGHTKDLEIVVELLSADAVNVRVGASAIIEGWGGEKPLMARVTRINPAGFTKISALGIEEQRVKVVLDLTENGKGRENLGHDYRVFTRITVWQNKDVLRAPISALFRKGADWAVYKFANGAAVLQKVKLGRKNASYAEIRGGLKADDKLILHPNDRIADQTRVEERKTEK